MTRPWLQSLLISFQTVQEHLLDNPVQLVLQGSRRLPVAVRTEVGRLLAVLAAPGHGVVEAIGHEIAGKHEQADDAIDRSIRWIASNLNTPGARRMVPHIADTAIAADDPDRGEYVLNLLPAGYRGAPWYATAARLAQYRGDLNGAVNLARRFTRNRHLARRLLGEQAVFAGTVPKIDLVTSYEPISGRVLHVLTNSLPHTGSGYAQRSHSILRSLTEKGYDVQAITRPGYPAQVGVPFAASVDDVEGVRYIRLLPRSLGKGMDGRLQQHAQLLAAEVEKFRPAVIHTTTHFVNAVVVRAVAEAYEIPWVYEVRGQLADTWASKRGDRAYVSQRYREFQERELEAASKASAVVTLGENMKTNLVDNGIASDKISVSPNAVGSRYLEEPPTQAQARSRLGIEPEIQLVGTVSSIVEYEGLDLLVRAVADLASSYPQLRLRIAGDGVALPGLKALAQELEIDHLCEFSGRVERSEAIWNQAALDLFVVPRKNLPVTRAVTPMKTVEASAVGVPVVASDLPALQELVTHGVTGYLFDAENLSSLTKALSELLSNPKKCREMGNAARAWALETRTWAANAEIYSRIYEQLTVDLNE